MNIIMHSHQDFKKEKHLIETASSTDITITTNIVVFFN